MVKNTTGHVIKKGTPIALRYAYRCVPGAPMQHVRAHTQIAYCDVLVNDSIGLDQPRGAMLCAASVILRPDVQTKIKTAL